MRLMEAKMQDIVKQSEVVLNQVLGLSVTSDLFSGYTEMNAYERLNLMRNINGTLSNIRIANNSIDHIYPPPSEVTDPYLPDDPGYNPGQPASPFSNCRYPDHRHRISPFHFPFHCPQPPCIPDSSQTGWQSCG